MNPALDPISELEIYDTRMMENFTFSINNVEVPTVYSPTDREFADSMELFGTEKPPIPMCSINRVDIQTAPTRNLYNPRLVHGYKPDGFSTVKIMKAPKAVDCEYTFNFKTRTRRQMNYLVSEFFRMFDLNLTTISVSVPEYGVWEFWIEMTSFHDSTVWEIDEGQRILVASASMSLKTYLFYELTEEQTVRGTQVSVTEME